MAEFRCWNPYWVLCAVNTIRGSRLEHPAGSRGSIAAGDRRHCTQFPPPPRKVLFVCRPVIFFLTHGWVITVWLRGCGGGMTNKMLLLCSRLLSQSSQPWWTPPPPRLPSAPSPPRSTWAPQSPESNASTWCLVEIQPFIPSVFPVHSGSWNKKCPRHMEAGERVIIHQRRGFYNSVMQLRPRSLSACHSPTHSLPVWDGRISSFPEFPNGQFSVTQTGVGSRSLRYNVKKRCFVWWCSKL